MEENLINKDINICFLSGKIVSKPEFKFFYNSKKYISKISFILQTEIGFVSSRKQKSILTKIIAYDEKADLIYRNFNIYDTIKFEGFLKEESVVLTSLLEFWLLLYHIFFIN